MTPAARIAAAIEVLDRWRQGVPVEQALTQWARGARYAGSKDRRAVRDHVFDVMRQKDRAAALGGGSEGRAMLIGWLRLTGQDPTGLFTGVGHAPAQLTVAERGGGQADPGVLADLPDWLRPSFDAAFGRTLPDLAAAMGQRAPVFLRVNARKVTAEQAIASLSSSGVEAERVDGSATALRVRAGAPKIRLAPAYADGWIELQDLSVQRACARVDWPETGRILDYCAGGGGKALAIAAVSDAKVDVHDALPRRMADLPARAARAGVDLRQVTTAALRAAAPYDLVLTDVPCSGSGTWRRDPEAKWRLTATRLTALTALQDQILDEAARRVRPGGRLVYMTCSLLPVENAERIAAFLSRQRDWHLIQQHQDTPLTASDGFFLAELTQNQTDA